MRRKDIEKLLNACGKNIAPDPTFERKLCVGAESRSEHKSRNETEIAGVKASGAATALPINEHLKNAEVCENTGAENNCGALAGRAFESCDKSTQKLVECEKKPRRIGARRRYAFASLAAACILFICAAIPYLWQSKYSEVYIDVNPSLELELNRFDSVIGVKYINADAEEVFGGVQLVRLNVAKALENALDALYASGYLETDTDIVISSYSKDEIKSEETTKKLCGKAEEIKQQKNYAYKVNGEKIDKDTVDGAKDKNISPAKLKIVDYILSLGGDYSFEELADKSMGELYKIAALLDNERGESDTDGGNGNGNGKNDKDINDKDKNSEYKNSGDKNEQEKSDGKEDKTTKDKTDDSGTVSASDKDGDSVVGDKKRRRAYLRSL